MGRKRLVMIIDQHPDARRDLEAMLEAAGLVVVADAGYGEEASAVAAKVQPDLILAAVEEPVDLAIETARAAAASLPNTRIIAYSSLADEGLVA